MVTAKVLQVSSPTDSFSQATIERRELGPCDVLIDIKFTGICHSDIHTARGEWGNTHYPITPGHEITGVISALGSGVTKFSIGDRVGVGCMVNSCGNCPACLHDAQQLCYNGVIFTYGYIDHYIDHDDSVTQGGYSDKIVVDENFVVRIPDNLPLDKTAPLLCAGITMFSPLQRFNVGSGSKVAIIGLGGLGHVAVKLAAALGAEVTVLSQSLKKLEDGLRLGAHHYYATSDEDTFTSLTNNFDLILNTVSVSSDINKYMSLLRPRGTFVAIGLPDKPYVVDPRVFIWGERELTGSLIGGIGATQKMLDFCSEHNITAEIELISVNDIDKAYERTIASDVRYRFVIDISTFA